MLGHLWDLISSRTSNTFFSTNILAFKILHKNNFEYEALGQDISLKYETIEQHLPFRKLIRDDSLVTEDVPLRYLDLSPECDAFVNIGAYHGQYTVLVGKLNPNVEYYLFFEADDYNRAILRDSLALNEISATIQEAVVTDQTGEIPFYVRANQGSEGHSTVPHENGLKQTKDAVSISYFIDDSDFRHPFIKIDAEGEVLTILREMVEAVTPDCIEGLVELHTDKLNMSEDSAVQQPKEAGIELIRIGDTTSTGSTPRPMHQFTLE